MWRALVNQVLRLLVVFVAGWAILFFLSRWSCGELPGPEMEPAVKSGFKLLTRIRDPGDFQVMDVILYEMTPPKGQGDPDKRLGARVRALPGEKFEMGYRIWTHPDEQAEPVEIIIPRECLLVLGDNLSASRAGDSQAVGPVGQWAVAGRIRRGK